MKPLIEYTGTIFDSAESADHITVKPDADGLDLIVIQRTESERVVAEIVIPREIATALAATINKVIGLNKPEVDCNVTKALITPGLFPRNVGVPGL